MNYDIKTKFKIGDKVKVSQYLLKDKTRYIGLINNILIIINVGADVISKKYQVSNVGLDFNEDNLELVKGDLK